MRAAAAMAVRQSGTWSRLAASSPLASHTPCPRTALSVNRRVARCVPVHHSWALPVDVCTTFDCTCVYPSSDFHS